MRSKYKFFWLFYIIFYGIICTYQLFNQYFSRKSFDYFTLNCAIYNSDGDILFIPNEAVLCAYHDDGSVIETNPVTGYLAMYDKQNVKLWTSVENAHHMVNFTKDMKKIILLSSEVMSIKGQKVRSDCFSLRELNNKKIHEWCLAQHLEELKSLGFNEWGLWDIGINSFYKNEFAKKEISHANSFYEIPKNSLSLQNPAFSEGNFILHLYGPSRALLILDAQLQKILWHGRMHSYVFDGKKYLVHAHDSQVTPEGSLLSYFSRIEDFKAKASKPHSRILELNPITGELLWEYKRKPLENFYMPIAANVSKLSNGHYLFSDDIYAYETTSSGRLVWKFKNPMRDKGYPVKIMTLKPFYNIAFLKSRGIID